MNSFRFARVFRACLAGQLLFVMQGCASVIAAIEAANAPPLPSTFSYRMPTITPVQTNQQSLTKGGVTITVTPAEYREDAGVQTDEVQDGGIGVTCRRVQGGIEVTPVRITRVTTTPTFAAAPDRLVFQVRLTNQMERVFRGAGTIVQFNVAGQLVSVPQGAYATLNNLLLPPRNEANVTIAGPLLSTIPEGSTVGLFLYDVVTDIDAAGNPRSKQNFEWYYRFTSQEISKTGIIQSARREEPVGRPQIKSSCG